MPKDATDARKNINPPVEFSQSNLIREARITSFHLRTLTQRLSPQIGLEYSYPRSGSQAPPPESTQVSFVKDC